MKKRIFSLIALLSAMFITSCGEEPTTTAQQTTPAEQTTATEQTTPEATTPEQTTPEATTPEQTTPEETTPGNTGTSDTTQEEEEYTYKFTIENVTDIAYDHAYVWYMDGDIGTPITSDWPGDALSENALSFDITLDLEVTNFYLKLNINGENQTKEMSIEYTADTTYYYVGKDTMSLDPTPVSTANKYHMTLVNSSEEVYTHVYAYYMKDDNAVELVGNWPGAELKENQYVFDFEIEDEITSFTIILNNGAVEGGAQTENLTVNYQEDSTIYYIGNNVLSDTESGSGTTYVDYSFTITNVSEEVFDHIYVWTDAGAITGWPGDAFENNTHKFQIQAEPGVEKFNVILNNQSSGTQTKDMFFAYTKDVVMYYIGQGQLSTDPEAKPQDAVKYTVTLVDATEKYENIYLWQGGVQFFGAWPGTALVNHQASIQLEAGKYNFIFNGGAVPQTADLEFTVTDAAITVTWDGNAVKVA